ncbi:MAG: hypothetical protein COT92_01460 [Candidatus Doudnabacteria bacterium CG10_big_fil_rev_8_21_14_0_10_42_18]|uniref:Uncharacterized protein n=1 Tax=Candidatus Doudnabacteria bacterium CG10_big_fil_rev_8_21_14_0_10_42_18 TaxID=1974552 RepID=A0A2H0VDK2_9BACT|nr:MAG: hypothetical protein COT92_01460 [Candidatus Doudnabacteria bacterium CG10_big_fil_rev_8_21_14_0_10_42_18]
MENRECQKPGLSEEEPFKLFRGTTKRAISIQEIEQTFGMSLEQIIKKFKRTHQISLKADGSVQALKNRAKKKRWKRF